MPNGVVGKRKQMQTITTPLAQKPKPRRIARARVELVAVPGVPTGNAAPIQRAIAMTAAAALRDLLARGQLVIVNGVIIDGKLLSNS
jgi:UDP-N-acetyl-D-mannosaminuronate dehydrogenase